MKVSIIAFLSLLTGICATIIAAALLEINFGPEIEIPLSCNDNGRYKNPSAEIAAGPIGSESMNLYMHDFYHHVYGEGRMHECEGANAPADCPKTAAFISKKLIDDILGANLSASGIMCYFGWLESEQTMQLIVSPSMVQDVHVEFVPDHPNYLIKSYCPPNCYDVQTQDGRHSN